jgi:hypothetical protein
VNSLDLGKPTAEQRAAWNACPHPVAAVVASIGDPGNEDADARGISWHEHGSVPAELQGIRATVALGVCGDCGAPVVSLRMADYERWTPEHGPAWTTPWMRLRRDGEGSR